MSDEGQLLSDEERAALAEAVASGDMASDTGLNLRAESAVTISLRKTAPSESTFRRSI